MIGQKARQHWRLWPVANLSGSCKSMHHRHALSSQHQVHSVGGNFTENKKINAYIHPDLPRTDLTCSPVRLSVLTTM